VTNPVLGRAFGYFVPYGPLSPAVLATIIQATLQPLLHGRTSVVIAHRLSTVLAAGQILVMDSGRLVERETHEELVVRDGVYARLNRLQFASEAAADR
jgi:ATP-binding cassette subfamily B protein